jgi:hypothetical protein
VTLVLREHWVDQRMVWELTKKTGLRPTTVRNLLANGWTYVEEANSVPRWVSPLARLEEVKTTPSESLAHP